MAPPAACPVPDCDRPVYARGHCSRHYRQLLRHGEVRPDPAPRSCAVEGCGRRAVTRGWCHGHYLRVRRTGDARADVPLSRPQDDRCAVEGCERGRHSQQLCRPHAHRLRVHGDPTAGGPVRVRAQETGALSHGYWAVPVGDGDRHLVPDGRTSELEHRLVLARALGRPLTADETVHHRNGDRLDNRLDNLELWSTSQPKGQRVDDKLRWARELIARYDPEGAGAPDAARTDGADSAQEARQPVTRVDDRL